MRAASLVATRSSSAWLSVVLSMLQYQTRFGVTAGSLVDEPNLWVPCRDSEIHRPWSWSPLCALSPCNHSWRLVTICRCTSFDARLVFGPSPALRTAVSRKRTSWATRGRFPTDPTGTFHLIPPHNFAGARKDAPPRSTAHPPAQIAPLIPLSSPYSRDFSIAWAPNACARALRCH